MATKEIIDAIVAINPNAVCSISGEQNYENIEWQNGTTPIAKADVDAKLVELQAAEDAAVAQEATDKANANQKLLDLGLSQAEVDAFKK
jgi:hypothetical protein